MAIRFFAAGRPSPKGTLRAFLAGDRAHLTNASGAVGKREKTWAGIVSSAALDAMRAVAMADHAGGQSPPIMGPVSIVIVFHLQRPKSHFTKKGLRPSSPRWVDKKPDSDKLARNCLDALTGVLYADDAQVAQLGVQKRYADGPVGAWFEVTQL